MILDKALNLVYTYLVHTYGIENASHIKNELISISGKSDYVFNDEINDYSYVDVQSILSKLNEKESIRKKKGVYYTPADVVNFIITNSIKATYGKLKPGNIGEQELRDIPYNSFCTKKSIFDPTCGAGEYLLAALEIKIEMLNQHYKKVSKNNINKTVATIYGNDVNEESIVITKLRIFLCVVEAYGMEMGIGLSEVMKNNFFTYDYITTEPDENRKYSIIVGNPPYVEDFRSELVLPVKYGNIYANVLVNASMQLEKNGCIGFIVPLSYISTPRMAKLREDLFNNLPEQYILSYADRPDCLFDSVHQKLCIIIGKQKQSGTKVYTGNYQYWYKEERDELFNKTTVVRNTFFNDDCIPKLGTDLDISIYRKIMNSNNTESVFLKSREGNESVFLNRREAFWMKAYRKKINDPEYKIFSFNTSEEADYCYCLINSSLFWWYWISTSDCWHVSKELNGFKAPFTGDYAVCTELAEKLISKLEETKVFVGTKQTEYEYKHRECIREIHAIDDYINFLFGLTKEESKYIKEFAIRYRTSGGIESI